MDYIDFDWGYDLECYPNVFTMTIERADGKVMRQFEISDRKNDSEAFLECLRYMAKNKQRMVGFNNLGYDYPVLHELMQIAIKAKKEKKPAIITPRMCWEISKKQIESFKDGFAHTIPEDSHFIKQLDLFKIHHFDNKAKSTSLKMLEFNMRSKNIEDLPFPVGKKLSYFEIDTLLKYNLHDVRETLKFYRLSLPAIRMRADLSEKYGKDFTNFNDTKIGKEYFIMRLEEAMPGICYSYGPRGRKINQTKRNKIRLKDCLFDYYDFTRPEFIAVKEWFERQVITETKGVLSEIDEHALGDVAKYANLVVKRKKFKTKPDNAAKAEFMLAHPLGWIEVEELKGMENLVDDEGKVVMQEQILKSGKVKMVPVKVPKKSYYMCWKEAETLNVVIDGFQFDFGTGGIHGSISNSIERADKEYEIIDADV